jgi:hypothetical protein
MLIKRWLEQLKHRTPAGPPSFKPHLETLGDRVVPYASPFGYEPVSLFAVEWALSGATTPRPEEATVAASFRVVARGEVYAGTEMRVMIRAVDETGRPVRGYTGTVALTSSDPAAVLPDDITFTTDDRGRATVKVTLNTAGEQTITATDTASDTVLGTTTVNVTAAPVATSFFVRAERDATSGAVTRVAVVALDESNRIATSYTGTVALTSTDAGATLPESYTFTSSDRGVHVFEFTPSTTGEQTVTATDTADASLTGSVTVNVAAAQVATRFALITRPTAAADESAQVYVVALDDGNRIVRNYTGTVTLTSSDPEATLPEPYTFTAADRGVKALTVTFGTTGSQTVTATDDSATPVTGSVTVSVGTSNGRFGFGDLFGPFRRRR